jgi:hypothetical protein
MWEFIQKNQFVVGALSGSLAAYLLGLIVSHLRREKRWLGYSVTSRTIVQSGPSKLHLEYDGNPIKKLDSHTVVVLNIGNRPLGNLPVKIESLGSGRILESELSAPNGANFSVESDGSKIIINVDLLNPGETFSVGLTIADSSSDQGVGVVARAEYLKIREFSNQANTYDLLDVLLPHLYLGRLILDLYKIYSRRGNK